MCTSTRDAGIRECGGWVGRWVCRWGLDDPRKRQNAGNKVMKQETSTVPCINSNFALQSILVKAKWMIHKKSHSAAQNNSQISLIGGKGTKTTHSASRLEVLQAEGPPSPSYHPMIINHRQKWGLARVCGSAPPSTLRWRQTLKKKRRRNTLPSILIPPSCLQGSIWWRELYQWQGTGVGIWSIWHSQSSQGQESRRTIKRSSGGLQITLKYCDSLKTSVNGMIPKWPSLLSSKGHTGSCDQQVISLNDTF